MLETATSQTDLRIAYERAHAERSKMFRLMGGWIGAAMTLPLATLKTKRAGQNGQPLNCDCPA